MGGYHLGGVRNNRERKGRGEGKEKEKGCRGKVTKKRTGITGMSDKLQESEGKMGRQEN